MNKTRTAVVILVSALVLSTMVASAAALPPTVNIIDPMYIFADKTNVMWVNVLGGNCSNPDCTVNLTITSDCTGNVLFTNQTSGNIGYVNLGNWKPVPVENITLNATVVNTTTGESDTRIEVRNTSCECFEYPSNPACADCINDAMMPHTCYGYQGQHPLTEIYNNSCNQALIYTTGNYKRYNNTVNFTIPGDINRITNTTADIPANATIKWARLYVYYDWYKWMDYGATPDFEMTFNGSNPISLDNCYTDKKGFTTTDKYQYGMLAFDVTANVTGPGVYTATRTNTTSGTTAGMALLIAYKHPSEPHVEYYIDEGYDYLATMYWGKDKSLPGEPYRWHYYVTPGDATTTASFPCIDNPPSEIANATLFTATLYANPMPPYLPPESKEEAVSFNGVSKTPVWHTAYKFEIGTDSWDVKSLLNPSCANVADFQERYSYYWKYGRPYGNGFAATNAILIVEKEPIESYGDSIYFKSNVLFAQRALGEPDNRGALMRRNAKIAIELDETIPECTNVSVWVRRVACRPPSFDVGVSSDGVNWTPIGSETCYSWQWTRYDFTGDWDNVKYIGIRKPGGPWRPKLMGLDAVYAEGCC